MVFSFIVVTGCRVKLILTENGLIHCIKGQHFMELGENQDMAGGTTLQSVKMEPIVSYLKDEAPSPARSQKMEQLPEDPDVQKILSDPVNVEILSDPSVQKLFQSLRSNPEEAQRFVLSCLSHISCVLYLIIVAIFL